MKKKLLLPVFLVSVLIVLSACTLGPNNHTSPAPTANVSITTPAPVATPVPTVAPPVSTPAVAPVSTPSASTSNPTASNPATVVTITTPAPAAPIQTTAPTSAPAPAAIPVPTPTPTPAPTPAPIATPAPTLVQQASNLPVITKNPTGEKVPVGGKCQFVTRYENAKWAEWHFVSPDGSRDLTYKAAASEFPTLNIINGYAKDMTLENIPETLNGWKVYCKFSNDYGSVNTEKAAITVTGAAGNASGTANGSAAVAGAPKVTKSPTGETVSVGGNAWFVAKYEDAIWAVWHFVSPDNTRDLTYTDAAKEFPNLQIINGDRSTMQLKNIPSDLNGWKVYCAFRNNIGTTNTSSAAITVQGGAAVTAGASGVAVPAGEPTGTGKFITAYTASGSPVSLEIRSDGTWKAPNGVIYYLGEDKVLRGTNAVDLYLYTPAT